MYKKKSISKLGKPKDQREALIKSQVRDLITNGFIKTTKARAKAVSRQFDILMDFVAKNNERELNRYLTNSDVVSKIMKVKVNDHKAGYTGSTVIKSRAGDNAELVLVEILSK